MRLFRFFKIFRVVIKHRLDRLFPVDLVLPLWLRLALAPLKLFPTPDVHSAISLRLAFEELGPVFIKFGQILSTRKDLFTGELSVELEKLQDQVPPFDNRESMRIIEENLGKKITEVFTDFEEVPLASASLAQVHVAKLLSGEEVAIKVIRPGVEVTINRDLKLMFLIAGLIERFWSEGKRLHPVEIVEDYEHTILNELNLQLEASNTAKLRENWLDSNKLYVPEVYWDYSNRNVMVMERIYGVTASDLDTLRAHNVDLKKLAYLGVEIFFTQVFEDNFFHADMHPGNVFIDITDPANPTYIALDCAIIGSLTDNDKNYLARNLLAFFHQDYHEVARLHVASGWVPRDTNTDEFEAVIRSVCEPIFQKPIKDISFGKVLVSLFQTARQFNMEVQPQLVLLQKTLLNIEGMGRQIYDDLDLWETAAPFMEGWMENRMGLRQLLKKLGKNAPRWLEQLPEIPDLAFSAMTELKQLGDTAQQQAQAMVDLQHTLQRQARRSRYQQLGGMALIAAIFSTLIPLSGYASGHELLLGTSVLGSLGIYWMYIHT